MSAWSNVKPTKPGRYWWRGQPNQENSMCRVQQGVLKHSQQLFVKFEGMEEFALLDNVPNDFEWQPVKDPEP